MRKTITCVMAASAFAAMLSACSSIDCPLNSRVMTTCKFDQVFNDCSPMVFHEITDVKHTSHKVESVKINNSYVTYDTQRAHLIISLKTAQ